MSMNDELERLQIAYDNITNNLTSVISALDSNPKDKFRPIVKVLQGILNNDENQP